MRVFLLHVLWCSYISSILANIELDYYWVNYKGGPIPKNALKTDETNCVNPTYIGQIYSRQWELQPATINTNVPLAHFTSFDRDLYGSDFVKVLCSQFKENFKWVPANATNVANIPNKVEGGVEFGAVLAIGRTFRNGQPVVGKVGGFGEFGGALNVLVVPYNGYAQYIYENFEVLVYNGYCYCNSNNVCHGSCPN